MSTAHGAGLMLIPVLMGIRVNASDGMLIPSSLGLVAGRRSLLHTVAMVAVAGAVAFVVYEFLGVGFLRRGWLNLDRSGPPPCSWARARRSSAEVGQHPG